MHLIFEDSCSGEEGLSYHSLRSKKLNLLLSLNVTLGLS